MIRPWPLLLLGACLSAHAMQADLPEARRPAFEECTKGATLSTATTRIRYLEAPTDDGGRGWKVEVRTGDLVRTDTESYGCFRDPEGQLWDFLPKFAEETRRFVVLEGLLTTSSGSNAAPLEYQATVFPKDRRSPIKVLENLVTRSHRHVVAIDPFGVLTILDLGTGKESTLQLEPRPAPARSPSLSIRKATLGKATLDLRYETLDARDEPVPVHCRIDLGTGRLTRLKEPPPPPP